MAQDCMWDLKRAADMGDVDNAIALSGGPVENFSGELSQFNLVNRYGVIEERGRIAAVGRPVQ